MKNKIIKMGVLVTLAVLLLAAAISAEKFSAKEGNLILLGNLTGFIPENTNSVLKADIRDGHGRVFSKIVSENVDGYKVVIKMDLRNPKINNSEITGIAKISYKITNNGFFVINPVPDEQGFFHYMRKGKKDPVKVETAANVKIVLNENKIGILSDVFKIEDLIIR